MLVLFGCLCDLFVVYHGHLWGANSHPSYQDVAAVVTSYFILSFLTVEAISGDLLPGLGGGFVKSYHCVQLILL